MYEFQNLEIRNTDDTPISSQAIKLDTGYLDSLIDGFRTLTVDGREAIGNRIDSYSKISQRDGDFFKSATLPPRYINVKFLMSQSSNKANIEAFEKLNALLQPYRRSPKVFMFKDEEPWHWIGVVESLTTEWLGEFEYEGSLTIKCDDPYKYSKLKTYTKASMSAGNFTPDIDATYSYPISTEELSMTASAGADNFKLTNVTTGRKIVINTSISSGDKIKITKKEITINNSNVVDKIDVKATRWHRFKIHPKDVLNVNIGVSSLTLKYKERRL